MHSPAKLEPPKSDSPHINALDGIRGLAILLVLATHIIKFKPDPGSSLGFWAHSLVDSAWFGVDIFLALSGFLITGILLRTAGDPHFFRNFYIRRALRIFPLYYGVLLVMFACTPILHIQWGGQQWRLLTYTNHLWLDRNDPTWNFFFGARVNLVNFWTLHVEEQFYFIWPLIVFAMPKPRRLLAIALVLSAGSLTLRLWLTLHDYPQVNLYSTLLTRADSLLIGGALAIALQMRLRATVIRAALPLFAASSLTLLYIFVTRGILALTCGHILFSLQFAILAIASTSLIALSLNPASFAARIFSNRVMRFFGKYSYGLYIYHSVLPTFLSPSMEQLRTHIPSVLLQNIVVDLIEVGVAVGISVLSFHYFEAPFLRLKRFFAPAIVTSLPADRAEIAIPAELSSSVQ